MRRALLAPTATAAACLTVVALTGLGTPAAAAVGDHCARRGAIDVPGAQKQVQSCLGDITTAGLEPAGKTNPEDYAFLTAAGTVTPTGVPGLQVDGYFPDTSTSNTNNGFNHDAQFVIRLPDRWNGGLVVTGSPGLRRQYANDKAISDFVVARGFAFASTDKGNTGLDFYAADARPGDAVTEWNDRVTELARAAKRVVHQRYGEEARHTYATGLSNGGYLTRWQLENHPELYDGGVDWEGTLFKAAGPNLFTYLPTALRRYPAYRDTGSRAAHDAMIEAGFTPGSEFLWDLHYQVYWDLTQRVYREEFDPGYDGAAQAGVPFCQGPRPCDAGYHYFQRPQRVRDAVRRISLTGRIGKPLLTLHGTLDSLLPIRTDSDVYATMIAEQGRGALHRYYTIEDGNHVDGFYDLFPDRLRPILPCYLDAVTALVGWVQRGEAPPPSGFIARPTTGGVVNACSLR